MKKYIAISLLLIVSTVSLSQQTGLQQSLTAEDYLKKSKSQKTGAWCLLGSGIVTGTIGFALALKETAKIAIWPLPSPEPPDNKKLNTGAALLVISSIATLASIPLFIAGARNKRKATSFSFKAEKTMGIQNYCLISRYIPSVSLKMQL